MKDLLKRIPSLRIALVYLVVTLGWLVFSEQLISLLFVDATRGPASFSRLQTIKEGAWIIGTCVFLFCLHRSSHDLLKTLKERLHELRNHQTSLLMQLPIGVYQLDREGTLVFENAIARRHREMLESEQGSSNHGSASRKSSVRSRESWRTSFEKREVYVEQHELKRSAFETLHVMDQAFPQYDKSGRWNGYLGFTTDITSLRNALRRANELQERLQLALNTGQIALTDWDVESNKVRYSEEWKRLLGYAGSEIGDDFDEWERRLHPDDFDRVRASVDAFLANPEMPFLNNFRLRHKDGTYRWIAAHAVAQLHANGTPRRVIATHMDITSAKQAEYAVYASQARIQQLLEATPAVLYALDVVDGVIRPRWVSESVRRILGYSVEEVLQPGWWRNGLHPNDRETAIRETQAIMQGGSKESEYRFLDKDGKYRWIHDLARFVHPKNNGSGNAEIIGCWNDISRRREGEEKHRLFTAAFNSIEDGVLILDSAMKVLSVNPSLERLLGYTQEGLIGKHVNLLTAGDANGDIPLRRIHVKLLRHGTWSGEIWKQNREGRTLPFWMTATVVRKGSGSIEKYIAILKDISSYKEQEAELTRLAHLDPLTGLPNRFLLTARLEHALSKARRSGHQLAVIYLDLDDFKTVNASLGHRTGDKLLIEVSKRLRKRVRESDTLARLGSDEFVILAEELRSAQEAALLAESILESLSKPVELPGGLEVFAEACLGISVYPDNGESPETLIQVADTAMHGAKQQGRNRYRFFASEMKDKVSRHLDLLTALRHAIDRDELLLHYQPKIDLRTGTICGAEALLRWHRPGQGLVAPSLFIHAAEVSGLISPLGTWVLRELTSQLRSWLDHGYHPLNVALNISARQFRDQDVAEILWDSLEEFAIPSEMVGVEITESALMENPKEAEEVLRRLKATGINISLDDFGTGFSSFAYLSNFSLDVLKIDSSFVRNINRSAKDNRIITSMVELAHSLNMTVIAEGVAHRSQHEFLRRIGCDQAQGYLFQPPVSADRFLEILEARR